MYAIVIVISMADTAVDITPIKRELPIMMASLEEKPATSDDNQMIVEYEGSSPLGRPYLLLRQRPEQKASLYG